MSDLTMTKTRIHAGIYEGIVMDGASEEAKPDIGVFHLDKELRGLELRRDDEDLRLWHVRFPIPAEMLTDGVQTFVFRHIPGETTLDSFTIVTGEPLSDDIRGEVDLLRAELNMLKKAFRRHCVETM
ncbi:MAG: hypothetical protein HKP40_13150 [Litoreibacter sp.]|nr:hypothetical protein [Litoreibacter sp.]